MKHNLLLGFFFGAISATCGYLCVALEVHPLVSAAVCTLIYLRGSSNGISLCLSAFSPDEDSDV